ncbi:Rup1 [Kluyveromyces lactis]|nr:Rup1 [Kluyveromyces lactis]
MQSGFDQEELLRKLDAVDSDSSSNDDITSLPSRLPNSLLNTTIEHWWKKDPSQLVGILPKGSSALLESYFPLFALCMAVNVPTKFLNVDFKELVYNPHWFKGELVQSDYRLVHRNAGPLLVHKRELTGSEYLEMQPELIPRMQLLIGVANDPESMRRFVASELINKGTDFNVSRALSECDHLSEVFPQFIKNLHNDMDLCLKDDKSTSKLFLSKALHRPNALEPFQPTSLSVLNFSPENYAYTLYEMFNPMLLPEDSGRGYEIENAFDFLAPVFTIIFDDMDDTTEEVNLSHGVQIPIEFYPQLYTKNALEKVVVPVLEETDALRHANKLKVDQMSSLQSFQGKQISSFLNSSINYLEEIPLGDEDKSKELVDTLEKIKYQLSNKKREMMADYTETQRQIDLLSFEGPSEKIIDLAKQVGIIDEPYLLRLVVFSPNDYIIARGIGADTGTTGMETGNNNLQYLRNIIEFGSSSLTQEVLTPQETQDIIKSHTRHASETPILFVYIKKDHIDAPQDILASISGNETLTNFLKEDHTTYANYKQSL